LSDKVGRHTGLSAVEANVCVVRLLTMNYSDDNGWITMTIDECKDSLGIVSYVAVEVLPSLGWFS
jgi:hypothetical protein